MNREVKCEDFEFHVQDLLDRRVPLNSDNKVKRHAKVCGRCYQILRDYVALDSGINLIHQSDPPPVRFLSSVKSSDSRLRLATLPSGWMVAAVMLIGVGLATFFSQGRDSQVNSLANNDVTTQPLDLEEENDFSLPQIEEPESVETEEQLVSTVEDPSPIELTPFRKQQISWDGLNQQLDQLQPYYHRYSAGLPVVRPVHASVNFAIDMFQRTLKRPNNKPDEPNTPDLGKFYAAGDFVLT